jgi:hypothetical protein
LVDLAGIARRIPFDAYLILGKLIPFVIIIVPILGIIGIRNLFVVSFLDDAQTCGAFLRQIRYVIFGFQSALRSMLRVSHDVMRECSI